MTFRYINAAQVAVVRSVEQAIDPLKEWGAPIRGRIAA